MDLQELLSQIDQHPLSVYVDHQNSDTNLSMHKHDKGQLGYIQKGAAYLTIGSKMHLIPAGYLFWVPANVLHSLDIKSATDSHFVYYNACNDTESIFYNSSGIYRASDLFIQMIRYIESSRMFNMTEPDCNTAFILSLKNILPDISQYSLPLYISLTNDPKMNEILQYMDANIAGTLCLKSVSTQFGMSVRSFSRLFQSTLQISFLQHVKSLRLIKAVEMIHQTHYSIHEIAIRVGYSSLSCFSNMFHGSLGVRPSDFRIR